MQGMLADPHSIAVSDCVLVTDGLWHSSPLSNTHYFHNTQRHPNNHGRCPPPPGPAGPGQAQV